MEKELAVLVSGTGSLLGAMIDDGLPIALVLADRQCRGVEIATEAGIDVIIVDRNQYREVLITGNKFAREDFTADVTEILLNRHIDIVVMAGFMTILSPSIFKSFGGRILNSHPSLLPDFKGDHAVRDALESGVKVTGTTIHIATEELDCGPILAQESVVIHDGDTVETLWERIKEIERPLYPKTIRLFAETLS